MGAVIDAGDAGSPLPSSVPGMVEPEPPVAAEVFGDRIGIARRYVDLLTTDGVVRGLIGPRETDRIWSRHVLNCLAVTELIPRGSRVVDVGTGAGLPGIIVAIARPDCPVVLLEPLERRVRFLHEVVGQLDMTDVRVVRGRAQDAPEDVRGADVVVSRAVAPLRRLAGWSAGLARPGGLVLALKGAGAAAELERDMAEVAAAGLRGVEVVFLDGPAGTTVVVRATRSALGRARSRAGGRGGPAGRRDGRGHGRAG